MLKPLLFHLYRLYLNMTKKTVSVGHGSKVYPNTVFEGYNRIGSNTTFSGIIGKFSYIGNYCQLKNTEVGRFCSIASMVKFLGGSHPVSSKVSSHPVFYSTKKQCGFTFVDYDRFTEYEFIDPAQSISCRIGNDVWIGENVLLIGKRIIGDGAIIAAGAVVTRDINPYEIVGGVPAKTLGFRFSKEEIEMLIKFKWWNLDQKWMKDNIDLFNNTQDMFSYIQNHEGDK